MADSVVLREFLVALGFKVDDAKAKKFDQTLATFSKSAMALGKSLVGIATAAQAMVTVFANQMEKLYYASKRTNSSIGNIQALEYAASRVGLTGDQVRQSLEGMAKVLRTQPGMMELLRNFGVKTDQDGTKMMLDLVKQLAKMPHWIGAQWAEMFGMDEATFYQLKQNADEVERQMEARRQMAAEMGVDLDKSEKVGVEYMNLLREIYERIGLLKDLIALNMLEPMKEVATVVNLVLKDWTAIVHEMNKPKPNTDQNTWWWRALEGIGVLEPERVEMSKQMKRSSRVGGGKVTEPGAAAAAPAGGATGAGPSQATSEMFAALEKKHGLPEGILDRIWEAESARGTRMLSKAGAKGHFQFMDPTAKQYGVTDPNDLAQSASGAAQMLGDLSRTFAGDPAKMAAAYNWGVGNVQRKGLGAAPDETKDYVKKVTGVDINQKVDIHVSGAESPEATARAVGKEQSRVAADIIRESKTQVE